MSRSLELPDAAYSELEELAAATGQSPPDWVVAQIRAAKPSAPAVAPRTLAERLAGRVGRINSGGRERLSENTGEKFADHVEEKRKAGHL